MNKTYYNSKIKTILLQYAIVFIILFVLCFWSFYFYGKSLIGNQDGIAQHLPALLYLRQYYRTIIDNIISGNFVIPMFDFTIGIGSDIIQSLNYYGLGDIFTLPSVFIPIQYFEEWYSLLIIIRMFCSGISFIFWILYLKKDA